MLFGYAINFYDFINFVFNFIDVFLDFNMLSLLAFCKIFQYWIKRGLYLSNKYR